jgi:hypothetical protein
MPWQIIVTILLVSSVVALIVKGIYGISKDWLRNGLALVFIPASIISGIVFLACMAVWTDDPYSFRKGQQIEAAFKACKANHACINQVIKYTKTPL